MSEARDGFDLDEFFADIKPTIGTAKVCPRGDLLDRHAALEQRLQEELAADAKRNKGKKAPALAEEMEALEAEIAGSMRTFRFQAVGRHAWRQLKREHPYRGEDGKETVDFDPATGQFVDFDVDTFPLAAIAASSLAPKITEAQAAKLDAELNDSQFAELWKAVVLANLGAVVDAPKSVLASAVLSLRNGDDSTTSSPEESPPASETDDDDSPLNSPSTTTPDG